MARDVLSRNNVCLAGNPDAAQALVFVNGLGTDQSVWNHVIPCFLADYRLVLFDHVGSTESNLEDFRARQLRYLNVSGYASDLLEICSALDLGSDTILIGHSLGGLAGLLASVQCPQQFKKLALLGMSPRYENEGGYEGGFSKADIDASYEALATDYASWANSLSVAAMQAPERPELATRFAESIARIPKDIMLTVLCSVLQTDHRSALPEVPVPVLLIQSRDDIFVPLAVAQYVQAHTRDCQLSIIDASGHLPHVTAPQKVIEAIGSFIGQ